MNDNKRLTMVHFSKIRTKLILNIWLFSVLKLNV